MINWRLDFVSSNWVCNHTRDWQITRMITDRIGLYSVLYHYQYTLLISSKLLTEFWNNITLAENKFSELEIALGFLYFKMWLFGKLAPLFQPIIATWSPASSRASSSCVAFTSLAACGFSSLLWLVVVTSFVLVLRQLIDMRYNKAYINNIGSFAFRLNVAA